MKKVIYNNLYMLRYIFKYCPSQFWISIIIAVLSSILAVANVLISKYVINAIINGYAILYVVYYILAIAIVNIIVLSLSSMASNYFIPRNTQIIHAKMQSELFFKTKMFKFKHYDNSEFYNKFSIAIQQSDTRALAVLSTLSGLIGCLFNIGGMLTLIATVSPFLLIIVGISVIISVAIKAYSIKLQYKYNIETIPAQRSMMYIQRIFYLREFAQEIRLHSSFSDVLSKKFSNTVQSMINTIKKYGWKLGTFQILSGTISTLVNAGTMA